MTQETSVIRFSKGKGSQNNCFLQDSRFFTFVSVCFNKNIHLRSPAFLSFSKMIKDVVVALCVRLSRSLIHLSLILNLIG